MKSKRHSATKKSRTTKVNVEVSIEREDHDSAMFLMFNQGSNRSIFRSRIYTRRANAIRGAIRYAIKNGYIIKRWLK